jgi:hypothetical protein
MLNVVVLEKLKSYLVSLGYSPEDISEIISSYTAIIPVLANISLRIYKETTND